MIPALDSCIPMYDPTFMTQGLVMVPCGPASDVVTCKPGTEDPVSGASNATDTPAEVRNIEESASNNRLQMPACLPASATFRE